MIKEEKPIFFKVFLIVVLIFVINIGVFSFKLMSNTGLTGLSVGDKVSGAYQQISTSSKIFLFVQWVVLAIVLIGVFIKDKGLKTDEEDDLGDINLESMSKGDETDLDVLYNVLKKKKKLRISSVAKLFKIEKEVAMDWCKTLEAGSLGIIEYPSAREPVIRIIEK